MKQALNICPGIIFLILLGCTSGGVKNERVLSIEIQAINDSLIRERVISDSVSFYLERQYFLDGEKQMTYLLSSNIPNITNAAINFYPDQKIKSVAAFKGTEITNNIKGFHPNGRISVDRNERTAGYVEVCTYFDNGAIHLYKLETPTPDSKLIYQVDFDSIRPAVVREQGEPFFLWVNKSIEEAEESIPFLLFTSNLPYHEYELALFRLSASEEIEERTDLDFPKENFLSLHLSKQVLQEASYLVEMRRKSLLNDSVRIFQKIISKN